ncbi:hypothetical protein ACR52_22770 [Pseudomonas fildesensis]|uniref:Transposase n=1 Tax=Pseudomonas fildesensis TaxID=1674920 RepID=A0A0J8FYB8_9PSED|nr:hypothetical protein ACR52_22770 [Pseudomonas fildesensis]
MTVCKRVHDDAWSVGCAGIIRWIALRLLPAAQSSQPDDHCGKRAANMLRRLDAIHKVMSRFQHASRKIVGHRRLKPASTCKVLHTLDFVSMAYVRRVFFVGEF